MLTIAFHTLGCKVNQYDTQAMLEAFEAAGYQVVPFDQKADVYVVNTCTVTGTGDKKSLQTVRRVTRLHPGSQVIIAGCLAQRLGEKLLETGARLIIGNQHRAQVVNLFEKALAEGIQLCAVDSLQAVPYENLTTRSQQEHTRAVLKIQEGCDRHCTYCIIPSVRGPIRSKPLQDIVAEARSLSEAGFSELVITGIHLTSYGRDHSDTIRLADVVKALNDLPKVARIRLGSLEPTLITPEFIAKVKGCQKLCPQFHLALQSGSDTVLARMARRYNMAMYMKAVELLKEAWPMAAFTTDILTGFPGETQQEYEQTRQAIKDVGFAKIHVFPYSPREGTKAASLPGQLTRAVKEQRARELIALGETTAQSYHEKWLGQTVSVLFEEEKNGLWEGYTPEYIHVTAANGCQGQILPVRITGVTSEGLAGEIC
ncbi:MAG: tRNA (N(6)-L-threonylcarbamoyladenosine(37)-C(2))-methylthiotransferase MtaB [Clostridia bacterium]|nr:tRNA (N(6)-L-threonylcarbamoyladenosine(37)-C(2))-methylthiotransferase MtaB [Clostridia bacterium]